MRDNAPPMYAGTLEKALSGKASPRAAIKAMCLQCTGYSRQEIIDCAIAGCPLHAYRPFTGKRVREASGVIDSVGVDATDA